MVMQSAEQAQLKMQHCSRREKKGEVKEEEEEEKHKEWVRDD